MCRIAPYAEILRRGRSPWGSVVLFALLAGARSLAAQTPDQDAVGRAAELLSDYIRIDTSVPENQGRAAAFLAGVLEAEGIPVTVWEPAPGRANLMARFEGTGSGGAVVLLHHMDVVPATSAWSVPPFEGLIRDDAVWGRGAQDMKGVAVAQLMALFRLQRQGLRPVRDIVVLATADEETGSPWGLPWVLEHHAAELGEVAYVLTEGGGAPLGPDDRVMYWAVGVAEKTPLWLELVATGTAGHGSIPVEDGATNRLVKALDRIRRWQAPPRLVPAVRRYFETIAHRAPLSIRPYLLDIDGTVGNAPALQRFTRDPFMNALVRSTVSITVLEGAPATNVLPATARAELDVRLLPGEEPDMFLDMVRAVVDDDSVQLRRLAPPRPALASPVDTWLFRAIQRTVDRVDPGGVAAPLLIPGFTDCHHFRARGVTCYGLEPFPLRDEIRRGIHGVDEHLPIAALVAGVRFYEMVLREVAW